MTAMSNRMRNRLIVLVVVVSLGCVVYFSKASGDAAQDTAAALARRPVVTEVQDAQNAQLNCRLDHADAFMGAVGARSDLAASPEQRAAAANTMAHEGSILAQIAMHSHHNGGDGLGPCPEPVPAVFDDHGNVVVQPVIPEQYSLH